MCNLQSLIAKKNMGFALHYNINASRTVVPPATLTAPNPELWELQYRDNKEFILINSESGNEEVRDIDWSVEQREGFSISYLVKFSDLHYSQAKHV